MTLEVPVTAAGVKWLYIAGVDLCEPLYSSKHPSSFCQNVPVDDDVE